MKSFAIISAALLLSLPAAAGQASLSCDRQNEDSYCEIRELTVPFSGSVDVHTGGVGAITVKGWDNTWVSVFARITANAEDEFHARLITMSVAIDTSSNRIWASGPFGKSWAVSYEVYVPRASGLELKTGVGAIAIQDVAGRIHFNTGVGAVTLAGLAGEVEGRTGVGAISMVLGGDRWEGEGVDVETGTGAIRITAVPGYSARFDLRTRLGAIHSNLPGARASATGLLGGKLVFQSGAGGPRIRASTSIGEIELKAVAGEP